MYNPALPLDILNNVNSSIDMVLYRFGKIKLPSDFTSGNDDIEILDSISMRLQFIGESLKRIEKIEPIFLNLSRESNGVK
jgi:hypothetical protein